MSTMRRLTAVIEREGDGYVTPCPEFDIASKIDQPSKIAPPEPRNLLPASRPATVVKQ